MSYQTYMQNFLHPPKKPPKPMMKVFPDGREILDLKTTAGATEYQRRKLEMWERQGRRCALQITDICKQRQGRWPKNETQFDHEHGRGGGKQDDRIEVLDPETGKMKWQSATVCAWCNSAKGSRKMAYNLAFVP
jgi:hypothetical protein